MFFCRHDESLLSRVRRRVESPRAAVFAEFCLIAPLLVMLVSGMIEIAGYFDARVMANHTAWTIGRQATVHMEELTTTNATGVVATWHDQFQQRGSSWAGTLADRLGAIIPACKDLKDHGKITAVMLMATCGIGYYGSTPSGDAGNFLKKLLVDPIKGMFAKLKEQLSQKAGKIVPEKIPGSEWLNKMLQNIVNWLFKTVVDPIVEKVTGAISAEIDKLVRWIDAAAAGPGAGKRRFRQIYGAARRAVKAKDPVYAITHLGMQDYKKVPGGWADRETYRISSENVNMALDFPASFNRSATWKNYTVRGYHGWPPPSWSMSLMRVDVNWPYEMGWLFPVVSGFRSPGEPVVASGSSLVFPQPEIDNAFLRSEGARAYPYDEKGDELAKALQAIAKEARQYLRAMIFALRYRLREESMTLGTHEHGILAWRGDRFYKDLIYFWFDQALVDSDPDGASKPWGSIGSTDTGTIRDTKLGYYQSWRRVCDDNVYLKRSTAEEPLGGQQHRNRNWRGHRGWFYWHNQNTGGRVRARYFHPDGCGFADPHKDVLQKFPQVNWNNSVDRMRKFRQKLLVYCRELQEQLEGRGDPGAGGPANLINFSDMKGVDLSNVKAVTEYFQKKWSEMRTKCEAAFGELDGLVSKQQEHSENVLNLDKDRIAASADYVYNSFPGLKDAECKLCGMLGSKSAQQDKDLPFDEWMKRDIGPKDDGKSRDPYKPGSDTESWMKQDEWKWSKEEGWK